MKLVLDANGVIVNATQAGPADAPAGGSVVTLTTEQTARYYSALSNGPLAFIDNVFIPQMTTSGRFMQALIDLGFYNAVNSTVAASGDLTAQTLWARASQFLRQDPLLIQMGAAAGLSAADMNAVFVKAWTY